ncbi:hypothetical protein FQN55_003405 [Onygenales sp. PD_40]|nr:hypothetical protein FQN55_003405 [Onygenales sp. PD_40]KAK2798075.1 hypothetical protein FQN51_007894 [Onygenales sp. PD_10]
MYDSYKPHPLLAQIPLAVSPFISLPTATTLPYTYKSMPSTLPPSVTVDPSGSGKARYVVSAGGHAAHPDEILASCEALEKHMKKVQADNEALIKEWEDSIKKREAARNDGIPLFLPIKTVKHKAESHSKSSTDQPPATQKDKESTNDVSSNSDGEELDRALEGLDMR